MLSAKGKAALEVFAGALMRAMLDYEDQGDSEASGASAVPQGPSMVNQPRFDFVPESDADPMAASKAFMETGQMPRDDDFGGAPAASAKAKRIRERQYPDQMESKYPGPPDE